MCSVAGLRAAIGLPHANLESRHPQARPGGMDEAVKK